MIQVQAFLQNNSQAIREIRNLELIRLKQPAPVTNARNATLRIYRELLENFESTFRRISSTTQLLYWGFIRTRIAGLCLEAGDRNEAHETLKTVFLQAKSINPVNSLLEKLRFPKNGSERASGGNQLDRSDMLMLNIFAGLFQTAFNLMAASLSDPGHRNDDPTGFDCSALHWLQCAKRLHELYVRQNPAERIGPTFWETIQFRECLETVGDGRGEVDRTQEMSAERLLFEHGYTSTLFLLAQAYQLANEPDHSAACCQLTLSRQLIFARPFNDLLLAFGPLSTQKGRRPSSARRSREPVIPGLNLRRKRAYCLSAALQPFDPVEWAANAASLGRYYASVERNNQTYYGTLECFVSACAILDDIGQQPQIPSAAPGTKSKQPTAREQRVRAETYRDLAEFGLNLLESGSRALKENAVAKPDSSPNPDRPISKAANDFGSMFQLNLHQVLRHLTDVVIDERPDSSAWSEDNSERSGPVSRTSALLSPTARPDNSDDRGIVDDLATCPIDYSAASRLFRLVTNAIAQAEQFYTLDERCSDAVALVQSRSKAYRLLTNFESDKARQCRMHKRRVDMLDRVLKPLSRIHYLPLCRQLLFELAEACSTLRDLKQDMYDVLRNKPSKALTHYARKANQLTKQALQVYQEFLGTFSRPKQPPNTQTFAEEEIRQVMLAHFYSARLFSRLISISESEQVKNLTKSLAEYRTVVALVDTHLQTHPHNVVRDSEEVGIARDMCNLLPVRLTRLSRGERAFDDPQ